MEITSGSASALRLDSAVPAAGLTIHFSGQWIFAQTQDGTTLSLPAPNAEVIYSPTATTSTTSFTSGQWVTTVPSDYTGNVFLSGLAYQVPAGVSLQGAQVSWTGEIQRHDKLVPHRMAVGSGGIQQLGALTTSNTAALYSGLGIKPIDANAGSLYLNSDNAGTPENFVSNVIAGATGNGGTDYTGSYSNAGTALYQAPLLNQ